MYLFSEILNLTNKMSAHMIRQATAYEIASVVVIIMSLVVFLRTLDGVFDSALTGIEKVDLKNDATFKDYIKSRLFFVPSLRLIRFSSYTATFSTEVGARSGSSLMFQTVG